MSLITFDATLLSIRSFVVSPGGELPATEPQTIELEPGTHTFGTLVDPGFEFEVTPDGTVDYASGPLDAFLSGRGTGTLHVAGFEVAVDATALSLVQFWLQDGATGARAEYENHAVETFRGIPGSYRFSTAVDPFFDFQIAPDGMVDYAGGPLDGFLAGRGTTTLRVDGFAITVDATPLSLPLFWLQDAATGFRVEHDTADVQTFTAIPGSYRFSTLVDPSFDFAIAPSGTVDYPVGPMDSWLAGRGSTTLRVYGYLVGVDASQLELASFTVLDHSTGIGVEIATDRFHCMSLIPGAYDFVCGFTFAFIVEGPGVFTYDLLFEPSVTGHDTQRLHVAGDPVAA